MNPKWGGQGLITECDFWKGGNRVTLFEKGARTNNVGIYRKVTLPPFGTAHTFCTSWDGLRNTGYHTIEWFLSSAY